MPLTAENTLCAGTAAWQYEYFHKDQLGNVRLAFTDRNEDGKVELPGENSVTGALVSESVEHLAKPKN